MIEVTYNVQQAMRKGHTGYKPMVRGHVFDNMFYRSIAHCLRSAEKLAKSEAIILKRNGHETVVCMGKGLVRA